MKTEPKFVLAGPQACSEMLSNQIIEESASIPLAPPGPSTCQPLGPREIGGRKGMDPTRYGDWEKDGRCIDF